MEQSQTQQQVLDGLVDAGRLTREEADLVRSSPVWSLTARELVSYLAGLVILVGVVRVVNLAFRDASQTVTGTALLIAGAVLAVAAWKLPATSAVRARFAEVLETLSGLALAAGTGVLLGTTSVKPEVIVLVIGAAVSARGYVRSRTSVFAGSLALVAGLPMCAFSTGVLVDGNGPVPAGILSLVAGAVLLWLGQRTVHTAFLQRGAGAYFVLMGSFMVMAGHTAGGVIPIAAGAVLFMLGSRTLQPESLVAGAISITVGVTMLVGDILPSELTRGIATIGTGAFMLSLTRARMRVRRDKVEVSPPAPGTPSA